MSKTAVLPQGKVTYLDRGEGDPLLFVHGLLVDGRLWQGVADRLDGSFRCIMPDWPMGSHRTALDSEADLSPPGIARLIAAFMDALELDRVTLVGNDTGGAMSQIFTAAYPGRVERLILTNCDTLEHFPPFPFNGLPVLARLPGGITVAVAPFRIGAIGRLTYGTLTARPLDPELVRSWLEPVIHDRHVRRDTRKLTAGIHKRHTLAAAEQLRSFDRPVRFVWGTADRFFKLAHAERLAAMLVDGEIATVDDAATFSPLDRPEAVADRIAVFARATTATA
jgi:pimeloyl-ACP methyl ester carboxylesterase